MNSLKDNLIAKKYAEALADIKLSETLIEDLEHIKEAFLNCSELRQVMYSPSIELASKIAALRAVFAKLVQEEVLKVLQVLLHKRRIRLAPLLAEHYKKTFYKRNNIEHAEIVTASEFSEAELQVLRKELEKNYNKEIKISNKVNADLIAGLRIKVAGKLIDSSLSTKLKKIKSLLSN